MLDNKNTRLTVQCSEVKRVVERKLLTSCFTCFKVIAAIMALLTNKSVFLMNKSESMIY